MNKKLIYIGNNLAGKTNYLNMMSTLSGLLEESGFEVICASNQKNQMLRFVDMVYTILKHKKNVDFVLIDTFSTRSFYYALLIAQLSRLLKLKYIPILHGGNLPKRLQNNRNLSKLLFSKAFINCSPSLYLKEAFEKQGFKTIFIPNFISIKDYTFKKRSKVNCQLLWVRAFEKTYNPLLVIEVLKALHKDNLQATICMVGPEKDATLKEFQQQLKENKLINHVKITGVLSPNDWHQLSNDYDIFINTTNADNMPVSIIEAMALGFPIVSTNAGGLPYLLEDGETGILVNTNDGTAMAKAIKNLVNNASLSEKLSLNARKKATEFDKAQVKSLWINLLTNYRC